MMSDVPKPAKEREFRKSNSIQLKGQAVICILTTAILSLVFLVQIIVWAALRPSLRMPQESVTCIPCYKMKSNANTKQRPEGRIAFTQRDDGMCCGPAESITQILIQMEMAAQYHYGSSGQSLIDIAEEYASCERERHDKQPVAKAVGIVKFKPSDIVNGHHKSVWNKSGGTFDKNKFIHLEREGELFVRQAGYYIVSSQLNIRPRKKARTPMNVTRPTTFSHHVDLLSQKYGTTGVLMQTMNSIERNGGYYTSFLLAVFKLNKYDRLSVSVSHPELLDIDNYNDHFLVYYTYDLLN